uniref:Movement protein TGBp3 n=1 Tax=Citrus yellow vein clearing virus TaxID=1214459 RepID=A0A2R3WHV3_9VIRU|nr:6.4 kDa triple gene block protein [Citrus yellow vein clearing virus]
MQSIDLLILAILVLALIANLLPAPEPCTIVVSGASASVTNCPNPEQLAELVRALKPAKPV